MPESGRYSLDIPQVKYGVQEDYRDIYFSEEHIALRAPITIQAGFGLLKAGLTLALNLSGLTTGNIRKAVPYNPTSWTKASSQHPGRIYLVVDSGTTATILYTSIEDSYKFAVGDDCIINSSGVSAENLGAITAIDRTTDITRAAITVTTATGGSSFTVAEEVYIAVEAGISANNYSDCVGILEKTVHTGLGVNAEGAHANVILSNALLYEGLLLNLDAAAKTDISAVSFGQFLKIP